ncbi:PREDICTED: potassium/sodium hyperpolarization-activated cyclic nucleotide-gated channel 1-like [Ceratosolen solmsi marchali]|uniref:Potassium/sodium hyperpolarization-activated cyclic nucleotide-gated channel 1-like n=1 Tax=Ceratosolen solmsi marchali TaxID=326594 RepID=A0AAJ7DWF1_9HYME|nr:PREDICTED: potassium/sodium hyperpolarization-activated cyclic nucleotide-gated channel 1-like [Ceratosolen solmsi marchali]
MHLINLIPEVVLNAEKPKPVLKHTCRIPSEPDEVDKLIKGSDLFSYVNRWFMRKRILSPNQYYAQTYLKSTTAIKREINNHLLKFPFMIHPFSSFRNLWYIIVSVITIITLVWVPFLSAFYLDSALPSFGYLVIIDIIMVLDNFIYCLTGYYDQITKKVILDPKIVFKKYVTSFFIFDFFSALPFQTIDFIINNEKSISWYGSIANCFKIFRVGNLIRNIRHLNHAYNVHFQIRIYLDLFLILTISLHWSACMTYYVPLLILKFPNAIDIDSKSWILSKNMEKRDTKMKKYILSMNRAMISLVSSEHYLDVATPEDMIINFILSIIGKIGFIYLLSQFSRLITTLQSFNNERLKLLQQLQEYMQYKELPRVMQKRLLEYSNYWYKKNFIRDTHILSQVSEPLRKELIFHNYKRLLDNVKLFKYLPEPAIEKLIMFIKPELYLSNDIIVKSGTIGDTMYFIDSGTVAVYSSFGKEICHLEDGSYFGEMALVIENEQRIADVVAIETCEILKVSRDAFLQIVATYPNLLGHLQKVVLTQLATSVPLNDIYKREDLERNYVNISNLRRAIGSTTQN